MSVRQDLLSDVALDALPVAVVIADGDATVLKRNRAADDLLPAGTHLADVLGRVTDDGRDIDWAAELSRLGDSDGPLSYRQLRLETAGGAARLVDLHVSSPDGPPVAIVVVEDVTEQASMARRLATTERLAAVGKLAAKVAHELNNPLDGILRFLGLAERSSERGDGAKSAEYVQKARIGVQRMAEIVSELLDYSRAAGGQSERLPIAAMIDQALEVMAPHLEAAAIAVVCDVNVSDRCVVGGELFQVLCNLIKNAVDAMASGGRLTLTAACVDDADVLTVADTGPGIDPEVLEKVFDPFFTTKGIQSGTGLGLSICRDIVRQSGGTISLANGSACGAVVTVTIPHRVAGKENGHE